MVSKTVDLLSSGIFLALSLLIISLVIPEFGKDMIWFIQNQFGIILSLSIIGFLIAFILRKRRV